jgi:hypothetical protein
MSRTQSAQFTAEHRVPHEVIAHILTYLQISVTTLSRWQQTSTSFYAAAEKYWEVLWNKRTCRWTVNSWQIFSSCKI